MGVQRNQTGTPGTGIPVWVPKDVLPKCKICLLVNKDFFIFTFNSQESCDK